MIKITKVLFCLMILVTVDSAYAQRNKLVVIHLRGGLDSLETVQPVYSGLRSQRPYLYRGTDELLMLPNRNGVLREGIHPQFPELLDAYNDDEAVIIHRVGKNSETESESEGYSLTSRGVASPASTDMRGWLQRLAQRNNLSSRNVIDLSAESAALAGGTFESMSMYGNNVSYYERDDSRDLPFRLDTAYAIMGDYQANGFAIPAAQRAYAAFSATSENLRTAMSDYSWASMGSGSGRYNYDSFGYRLREAEFYVSATSAKVIYIEVDGFNTFSNQRRRLISSLDDLNDALTTFRQRLTNNNWWARTIVLIVTDGGRTIREVGQEPEDGRIDRAYGVGTNFGGASDVYIFSGAFRRGGLTYGGYISTDLVNKRHLRQSYHIADVYAEVIEALGYSTAGTLEPYTRKRLNLF